MAINPEGGKVVSTIPSPTTKQANNAHRHLYTRSTRPLGCCEKFTPQRLFHRCLTEAPEVVRHDVDHVLTEYATQ